MQNQCKAPPPYSCGLPRRSFFFSEAESPPPLVQTRNQHFCSLSSRKAADNKELDKGTTDKITKDQSKLDIQSDIGEKQLFFCAPLFFGISELKIFPSLFTAKFSFTISPYNTLLLKKKIRSITDTPFSCVVQILPEGEGVYLQHYPLIEDNYTVQNKYQKNKKRPKWDFFQFCLFLLQSIVTFRAHIFEGKQFFS